MSHPHKPARSAPDEARSTARLADTRDPMDTIPPSGLAQPEDEAARRAGVSEQIRSRRGFVLGSFATLASFAAAREAEAAQCPREPRSQTWQEAKESGAELLPRATFTSMSESGPEDWKRVEAALRTQQEAVPKTVMTLLRALEGVYAGFGVDQLVHGTQAATRAYEANAPDELVLISLVHDMGKLLSNRNHPEIAGAIVRPYVSDDAYRILRHHMEFQWKHYGDMILRSSTMRDRYEGLSWYDAAATFSDEWDQTAFDPAYATKPLEEFEPLVHQFFGRFPEADELTANDCLG